jgi:DUF1680 family protein
MCGLGGKAMTKITDKFWAGYLRLVKDTVVPFQWAALNDEEGIRVEVESTDAPIPTEKSHAIENLKIAAQLAKGEHQGYWFQDTDIYKWLEAVGHILNHFPDKDLEVLADGAIDLIEAAMEDDGYLNTYYQLRMPERKFKELHLSHEMYCCGHMIEAAVAYYAATGKDKILKLARKFADCIDANFGPEEGKLHGADGHQEIELALVKLYNVTGETRYLRLAQYLLDVRGTRPNFFTFESFYQPKYMQAHKQPKHQDEAVGHAVRLAYMCVGMADVAREAGDTELLAACKRIWENITTKRMYVIGGIGSTHHGEAFTFDYDLPNDIMYCETCASIGLVYFARAMLNHERDSKYADVMERALYNNAIAGMAADGKKYFYVNPLESQPEANAKSPNRGHVKSVRPDWFGCACCPPNLARTISSIEKYITTAENNELYTHLYIGYEGTHILGGKTFAIKQTVDFGESCHVSFEIEANEETAAGFNFRIPNWAGSREVRVNGDKVEEAVINHGYLCISRKWNGKEKIEIVFAMPVLQIAAHPKVRANTGKVAIQRGPFVYCLEEADNGANLHLVNITDDTVFTAKSADWLAVPLLQGAGLRQEISDNWEGALYAFDTKPQYIPVDITMIPYFAWANRGVGEMTVWVNKR